MNDAIFTEGKAVALICACVYIVIVAGVKPGLPWLISVWTVRGKTSELNCMALNSCSDTSSVTLNKLLKETEAHSLWEKWE